MDNSTLSNADKIDLIHSLEGAEIARIISIACFSLAVYEYMITLDEEIKYFWSGKWTASRILFLLNRYLTLGIIVIGVTLYSIPGPSPDLCKKGIQSVFLLNVVAIIAIQGVLVVRIWYLFQDNKVVRMGIIAGFVASVVASLLFLYFAANVIVIITATELKTNFPTMVTEGCKADRPPNFWRIYLPSLVLHTALYILTALRALRNRRLLKNAPVLKRLLRDGGFFYFVVFISVILTTVGSLVQGSPTINVPAIYSHFLLTTTSVAVSRVMFSIHSLAHKLGSDSAWLLNNVELSRVGWRRGAREGELIVERFVSLDDCFSDAHSASKISLKETRVGVFDEFDG